MKTNKAIISLVFIFIMITNSFMSSAQNSKPLEIQFALNSGTIYNTSVWRENTNTNGHMRDPRYWYTSLAIAPKKLKFIGLNVFASQMNYNLVSENIAEGLQNFDIFTANGLESFNYGVKPFLYLDSRSWRIQIQADLWSSTIITPQSYLLEGIDANDMFISRTLSGTEQVFTKNIFQDLNNTNVSLYIEYKLNKNLGVNAKVNTFSFNYDLNTEELLGGQPNNFTRNFDVTTIQYGVGLTWTMNSNRKKPWQPKKYKESLEAEINRAYLPKKQTLTMNTVNLNTDEKIIIDFLQSSTENTAYFSIRNPQTGQDSIIGLSVKDVEALELEYDKEKLTLKTNDFLMSLGQKTDLVIEQPIVKKVNDHSVFYEYNYQLSNGDTYQAQALTDPLPLLWIIVGGIIIYNTK